MEENTQKKNTGFIVTIVILAICLLGTCGYIAYDKLIKKEEPKQEENKTEEKKEDKVQLTEQELLQEKYNSFINNRFSLKELENKFDKSGTEMAVVKNEVSKLIAYLNYQITDVNDGSSCSLLNFYFPSHLVGKQDLLSILQPEIMECIYGMQLEDVYDSNYGGHALISKSQYDLLSEYFNNVVELAKVDDSWVDYPKNTDDKDDDEYYNSFYENIKPYLNKDYYYAYPRGDGYGASGYYFEIKEIVKNGNLYEVLLNAYTESYDNTISMMSRDNILADDVRVTIVKYDAKLTVEVLNNHLKYHELIVNK